MYSIAHTQFLQWYRSRRKDLEVSTEPVLSETSVSGRAEVGSLLKSLRPEEQSALILCLGHEFTHEEAAGILEIPVGTVKSLILRAKQKLGEQNG